jgi:multicomponent Na+:H+ antiporter subunit C
MSSTALYGYCAAILVGLGLYGVVTRPEILRKILAFNVLGTGVFLLFGVFARRGAEAGLRADPVPQALVITGIVVAFSATALAVALLVRLNKETGEVAIASDDSAEAGTQEVRQ